MMQMPQTDHYRLLLDSITDYGIYMLSVDGRVSSWNVGAERLKGYRQDEIIGQHFSRFYTPEDLATGLPARALRTAASVGRFESEGWRLRKDGTRFWANAIIDAIKDEQGELIGFAKITRDLTERRMADQALAESRDMFRRLVQGVTDYALYMLSPEGIVTNWNSGAERIKGYHPDEIVGEFFGRFYTPEELAAGVPQQALETARTVGRYEREGWRVRKDGTRFLAHVIIDAIRDDDGTLLGFAKITRDITERAETQRKLEDAREQLLQAQKMEAIGQLTGGVAHDFNNLLMAVLSSLELLRKRMPQDEHMLRLLDNARRGAERGASLTRSMLAFARRQELAVGPLDVSDLIGSMEELLSGSVGADIEVQMQFAPDLPLALSDANQIAAAVLNLAVNARDAMPDGGTLTIAADEQVLSRANADLPAGRYVRLSVADTGEGMDAETLSHATEPFFTTKGVGKGTGLGLSMVHGIAHQSGGQFVLHSTLGQGTTAEIWLPQAETDVPAAPQTVDEAPTVDSIAERPLRVLAVDDDALVLMNTASMLEDLGHEVVEANSGAEALARLSEGSFDLVVTDHAMPRMTGLQLATAIRERWPGTPILIATGYAELPDSSGYQPPRLAKPFAQADLEAAVLGALQRG
jgi:PAS domain S-box-containing protein